MPVRWTEVDGPAQFWVHSFWPASIACIPSVLSQDEEPVKTARRKSRNYTGLVGIFSGCHLAVSDLVAVIWTCAPKSIVIEANTMHCRLTARQIKYMRSHSCCYYLTAGLTTCVLLRLEWSASSSKQQDYAQVWLFAFLSESPMLSSSSVRNAQMFWNYQPSTNGPH